MYTNLICTYINVFPFEGLIELDILLVTVHE